MNENISGLILLLLREGSTKHAVELYREETGASREEARRFVAELAERHGLRSRHTSIWSALLSRIGWPRASRPTVR